MTDMDSTEFRAALAEAWESGLNTGIGYAAVMSLPGIPEPVNPFGEALDDD